jgi:hypothetical protein
MDCVRHLAAVTAPIVVAVLSSACGGGGASGTPTPGPQISVSLSPTIATVQESSIASLMAIVTGDSQNLGVAWTISCQASECGTVTPSNTASGAPVHYTAPATMHSSVTVTVTATSVGDPSKSASATLIPVGQVAGYEVGIDYHSYGPNFDQTTFISAYDQLQVRSTVQAQLQGMADRGAAFIRTHIWIVDEPGSTNLGQTWRLTFPMTDQEAANLRTYAQDVALVQGAGGNRLRLDLAINWLGAADFTMGSPTTGLGFSNLSAAEFNARTQTTLGKVLAAVGDLVRPDGVKLVDTIFFVAEITLPDSMTPPGPITNSGWFLTSNYPQFVSAASQLGIRPSVYINGGDGCTQSSVLDDGYVDALFPVLNGHRSMFFPYRGLKFMLDNQLPLPSGRVDFDCYVVSTGAPFDQLLQRILDDADATLPTLGAPKFYDIPETYYLTDSAQRMQYGQAFAQQAAQNPRLHRVSFWTTPDGGGTGQDAAYPFTIEDFLPMLP